MDVGALLTDGFGRVREAVHEVLRGADDEVLTFRPDAEANTIAWLVWHLTRVQDDHVCEVAGYGQRWTEGEWASRFSLPFEEVDTGYGHSPRQVATVRASAELLKGYHDAVSEETLRYLRAIGPGDLDVVVDDRWDPPVTLGVRLVSVLTDDLQHAGQAAYLRGLAQRLR